MKRLFFAILSVLSMNALAARADSHVRLFPEVYVGSNTNAFCNLRLMTFEMARGEEVTYSGILFCIQHTKDDQPAYLVIYTLRGEQSFSPNAGRVDDPNKLELVSDEKNREAELELAFQEDSVTAKIKSKLSWLTGEIQLKIETKK